jgi:translation initiation factor 1
MSDRIVYSTGSGRVTTCLECGQTYNKCLCDHPAGSTKKKGDGIVRIARERKQRGGKTVTVISCIQAYQDELAALAQQLKKHCGAGGTVKDGTIEIQGDHGDILQAKLTELGYKVKRVGG